jgi:hypothetical protein
MKISPMLCASVVALVAFAISAENAFAGADTPITGVGVVLGKNKPAMGVAPSSGGPKNTTSSGGTKHEGQSTTVNTSRSNIKNN